MVIVFRRAFRFAAAGILATSAHALIAVCAIEFISIPPPFANGIAFAGATLLSFVVNTLWSFSSQIGGRTLFRFVIVSLFGLVLAMLLSWIAQISGHSYMQGIAAVVLVMPPITFFLHNFWTYR